LPLPLPQPGCEWPSASGVHHRRCALSMHQIRINAPKLRGQARAGVARGKQLTSFTQNTRVGPMHPAFPHPTGCYFPTGTTLRKGQAPHHPSTLPSSPVFNSSMHSVICSKATSLPKFKKQSQDTVPRAAPIGAVHVGVHHLFEQQTRYRRRRRAI